MAERCGGAVLRFCLLAGLLVWSVAGQTTDDRLLSYEVFDESPADTFIAQLATDADLTTRFPDVPPGQFRFTVLSPHGTAATPLFAIHPSAGTLRTSRRLDREELCRRRVNCTLRVDVAAHAPPSVFVVLKAEVRVADVNDHAPTFFAPEVTRSLPEDTPLGASFRVPSADDADSPRYGVRRYTLSGSPVFELLPPPTTTGGGDTAAPPDVYLVLRAPLDREARDDFRLVLTAYDGGVPALSGSVSLVIVVSDVNDNRPVFTRESYSADVDEDSPPGTLVLQVSATDADIGVNAAVAYAFSSHTQRAAGNVFAIDATTGNVTVVGRLDFEAVTSYALVVTASERGLESLAVEVRVTVRVVDRNDEAPVISLDSLRETEGGRVVVSEAAAPGSFVALLSVHDRDTGAGGQFSCALTANDLFASRQLYAGEFKLETLTSLDREAAARHDVVFTCSDRGAPALTSSIVIEVEVGDVNDNSPQFSLPDYHVTVDENNDVGASLLRVNATDADVGDNGAVSYRLAGSRYLSIDPVTGDVTAEVRFDHEDVRQRHLTAVVTASDGGSPSRSVTVLLSVTVTDVNDEAPVFAHALYELEVTENEAAGTAVAGRRVSAADADSAPHDRFTFSLDADEFSVNASSGEITTRAELDAETRDDYRFVVTATDAGAPHLTATAHVHVRVIDVNDHAPVIVYPNASTPALRLYARTPVGYALPAVVARDGDATEANSRLRFAFDDGSAHFAIDPDTGVLTVRADLASLTGTDVRLRVSVTDDGAPPSRPAHADYRLYVSAAPPTTAPTALRRHNRSIVVALSVVSSLLILVLVVAICVVRKQERRRRRRTNLNKLFANGTASADDDAPDCPDVYVTQLNNQSARAADHVDIGWIKKSDIDRAPSAAPNDRYSAAKSAAGDDSAHYQLAKGDSAHYQLAKNRPPPTAPNTHGRQMSPAVAVDDDDVSVRSGDVTNSDSGRGSNEDVQSKRPAHAPPPSAPDDSLDTKRRQLFGECQSPSLLSESARRDVNEHHRHNAASPSTSAATARPAGRGATDGTAGSGGPARARRDSERWTAAAGNTLTNTNIIDLGVDRYRMASRV